MPRGDIAAVVLAAGLARRAGGDKLTRLVDGVPMVARVVAAIKAAGIHDVIVVTGHRAEHVERALENHAVRFVFNESYADGMGTSLACGVAAAAETKPVGVLVMLGDMPWITAQPIKDISAAFHHAPERSIVTPVYNGAQGHPVIFDYCYGDELSALGGDRGAHHIITREKSHQVIVDIADSAIIKDWDSVEDGKI